MSASIVLAGVALATAAIALALAVRMHGRLIRIEAELAATNDALERQREAIDTSIATVRQATVYEVTTLLENFMSQVDTDVAARIAETLALQDQNRPAIVENRQSG